MNTSLSNNLESAVFAGGCFWCVEADFKKRPAIKDIESGYTGGETENPSYKNAGSSGHREAVRLSYNPDETSYKELLAYFFSIHNPTDTGGSFHDRGHTYTSAVYYRTERQKQEAEEVIDKLNKAGVFKNPIATKVLPIKEFWTAEEYHQQYAEKNVVHYQQYRQASGRDDFSADHKQKIFNTLEL